MPARSLVLLASREFEAWRTAQSTPFSACTLCSGTTRLEFVTSGRSVAISSAEVGQSSACAVHAPASAIMSGAARISSLRRERFFIPGLFWPGISETSLDQVYSWSEGLVRLAMRWGTEPEG